MMTVEQDIVNLLFAGAKASLPGVQIAWENVLFEPQADETYAIADIVPISVDPSSVGVDGFDRHRGFLQIMLVVPLNSGAIHAARLSDQVREYFKRGRMFKTNATELVIESTERHSSQKDKARVFYPISIYYRTDVKNG